jgi:hypothetical protein
MNISGMCHICEARTFTAMNENSGGVMYNSGWNIKIK